MDDLSSDEGDSLVERRSNPVNKNLVPLNTLLENSGIDSSTRQDFLSLIRGRRSSSANINAAHAAFAQTPSEWHSDMILLFSTILENRRNITAASQHLTTTLITPQRAYNKTDSQKEMEKFQSISHFFPDINASKNVQSFKIEQTDSHGIASYKFTPEFFSHKKDGKPIDSEEFFEEVLDPHLKATLSEYPPIPYNKRFIDYFNSLQENQSSSFLETKIHHITAYDPQIVIDNDLFHNLEHKREYSSELTNIRSIVAKHLPDTQEQEKFIRSIQAFAQKRVDEITEAKEPTNITDLGQIGDNYFRDVSVFLNSMEGDLLPQVLHLGNHFLSDPTRFSSLCGHLSDKTLVGRENGEKISYNKHLLDRLETADKHGKTALIQEQLALLKLHPPETIRSRKLFLEQSLEETVFDAFSHIVASVASSELPEKMKKSCLRWAGDKSHLPKVVEALQNIPPQFHGTILRSQQILEMQDRDLAAVARHLKSTIPVKVGDKEQEYGAVFHQNKLLGVVHENQEIREASFAELMKTISMSPEIVRGSGRLDRLPTFDQARSSDSEYETELHTTKNSGMLTVQQLPSPLQRLTNMKIPFIVNDKIYEKSKYLLSDIFTIVQPHGIKRFRNNCIGLTCVGQSGNKSHFTAHGLPPKLVDEIEKNIREAQQKNAHGENLPYYKIAFTASSKDGKKHILDMYQYDPEKVRYYDARRNGESLERLQKEKFTTHLTDLFPHINRSHLPPGLCTFELPIDTEKGVTSSNYPPSYEGTMLDFMYDENSNVGIASMKYPDGELIGVASKDWKKHHIENLQALAHTTIKPVVLFTQTGEDIDLKSAGQDYIKTFSAGHDADSINPRDFPRIPISEQSAFFRIPPHPPYSYHKMEFSNETLPYDHEDEDSWKNIPVDHYFVRGKVSVVKHNTLRNLFAVTFMPVPKSDANKDSSTEFRKMTKEERHQMMYPVAQVCGRIPGEAIAHIKNAADIDPASKTPVNFEFNNGTFTIDGKEYTQEATARGKLGIEVNAQVHPKLYDCIKALPPEAPLLSEDDHRPFDLALPASMRTKGSDYLLVQAHDQQSSRGSVIARYPVTAKHPTVHEMCKSISASPPSREDLLGVTLNRQSHHQLYGLIEALPPAARLLAEKSGKPFDLDLPALLRTRVRTKEKRTDYFLVQGHGQESAHYRITEEHPKLLAICKALDPQRNVPGR